MSEENTLHEPTQPALQDIPSVGKKDAKKNNIIWIGLIILTFIIYWLIKGYSHTTTKFVGNVNNDNPISQASENIDALKEKIAQANASIIERRRLQAQSIASQVGDTSQNPQQYTQSYLARLTADDTVYEASGNSAVSNNSSGDYSSSANGKSSGKTLTGDDQNSQFLNNSSNTPPASARAMQISHLGYTVVQGTLIPAVLEPAINSDLPGMVRAHTTAPIYSFNGNRVLIPEGSRLIGQYTSAVIQGQKRIYIAWNRLVTPSGISVMLNSPDTDSLGRSGEEADVVQTHFWGRFGEATLLSILGAGVSNVGVDSGTQFNSASAYRIGIAQGLSQSAQQSLQGSLPTKPTLIKYQGAAINVFVARDLSFFNVLKPHPDNMPSTLPLSSAQIQRLKALVAPNV